MAQTREGAVKIAARKAGLSVKEYTDRCVSGFKKCTTCSDWKALKNFSKDKSRYDQLTSRCKKCAKAMWRIKSMSGPKRDNIRSGDAKQARHRINSDVEMGLRPDPGNLFCAMCGHKGDDKRHEYHHPCGYDEYHQYDVVALCSTCHHGEHYVN